MLPLEGRGLFFTLWGIVAIILLAPVVFGVLGMAPLVLYALDWLGTEAQVSVESGAPWVLVGFIVVTALLDEAWVAWVERVSTAQSVT